MMMMMGNKGFCARILLVSLVFSGAGSAASASDARQYCERIFYLLDVDGNGEISRGEIKGAYGSDVGCGYLEDPVLKWACGIEAGDPNGVVNVDATFDSYVGSMVRVRKTLFMKGCLQYLE